MKTGFDQFDFQINLNYYLSRVIQCTNLFCHKHYETESFNKNINIRKPKSKNHWDWIC